MALRLDTNIVIVTIVFSALALISVILRFIAVARRNNSFALDDLLILLGLVCISPVFGIAVFFRSLANIASSYLRLH